MDLVEKLEARARELDRQIHGQHTYDQQAADDRELLEAAAREIKEQRLWNESLSRRSRTMNSLCS